MSASHNPINSRTVVAGAGIDDLPPEVIARVRREQEFFDQYSDPQSIPDSELRLAANLDLFPAIQTRLSQLSRKTVCDYGCGRGLSGAYFATHGATVHSFDVSATQVAIARRTARVNGVEDRMTVHRMAGENLSFPAEFFDFVFGTAVLHHVDLLLASRELRRVLKPNGVAVFAEPLGENKALEFFRRTSWWEARSRHTADERSLLYSDIEILRSVFPNTRFQEIGLLAGIRPLFRSTNLGALLKARSKIALEYLERLDDLILRQLPWARRFAYYVQILLQK